MGGTSSPATARCSTKSASATACRRGSSPASGGWSRISAASPARGRSSPALATLAWDPRRAAFFRGELFDALEIVNRGDIELAASARLVGRRDGPGAVHAVELPEVRRGLGRRRPPRHLVGRQPTSSRRSRNYLEGTRMAADQTWGREVTVDAGGRAADRRRRRAAQRRLPRHARHDRRAAARPMGGARRAVAGRQGPADIDMPPRRSCPGATRHFSSTRTTTRCSTTTARIRTRSASPCSAMRHVAELGKPPASVKKHVEDIALRWSDPGARADRVRQELQIASSWPTIESDGDGRAGRPRHGRRCASCGQRNRLAYERLGDAVRCGQCKERIAAPDEPIEIAMPRPISIAWWRRHPLPVIVDYWAPWCGPCRMVAPELQKVAARQAGQAVVVKVNTDELSDLGQRFSIRSIPTLAVFSGGKEVARDVRRPASGGDRSVHRRAQSPFHA